MCDENELWLDIFRVDGSILTGTYNYLRDGKQSRIEYHIENEMTIDEIKAHVHDYGLARVLRECHDMVHFNDDETLYRDLMYWIIHAHIDIVEVP